MAQNLQALLSTLTRGFNPIAGGPVGRRASAESQLRYLPALQALLLLGQQQGAQYHTDVTGARRSGYAAAQGVGNVRSQFLQQLADTQAPTSEAAAHLGLTRDAVAGDLAKMQSNQIAGVTANTSRLHSKYQSDLADIVHQMFSTADQGALYNQSQYEALASDDRKAKQAAAKANADRTAGLLKAGFDSQGNQLPGVFDRLHPKAKPPRPSFAGPGDQFTTDQWAGMSPQERSQAWSQWNKAHPKGNQPRTTAPGVTELSQGQHNTLRNEVLTARHWAKLLKPTFLTKYGPEGARHALSMALLNGYKSGDTKIPSFDQDIVTTALDLSFRDGLVSRHTAHTLNRQGYSVKRLGFKVGHPKHHRTPGPFDPGYQPPVQIGS